MGNALGCISTEGVREKTSKHELNLPPLLASFKGRAGLLSSLSSSENKKKKAVSFDGQLDEQALAAALLFNHHQRNNGNSLPFPRSQSVVYPSSGSKKHGLTRSSSSRPRSHSDSLLKRPDQLVNQAPRRTFFCASTPYVLRIVLGNWVRQVLFPTWTCPCQ